MDHQHQQQQQMMQQQQLQKMMQRQQQMQLLQKHQQEAAASSVSRFPPQFQSPQTPQQQIPVNPNSNHHQNPNSVNRSLPQAELQLAYQDLWRVCNPSYERPFSSLEDACERLLPYHVVADYEAEEDDRIIGSDTTGQMLSRSQQWEQNVAAKVAEYSATFEKQVHAFNIISHKRDHGEFRSEERLMLEKNLLQEQRQSVVELRAEWESRQH